MLKENIKNYLVSLLVTLTISIDVAFLYQHINIDLRVFKLEFIFIFLLNILLYFVFCRAPNRKFHPLQHIFCFLLGLFMIVGNSFLNVGSLALVYAKWYFVLISIFQLFGYYFLFRYLFLFFDQFLSSPKRLKRKITNKKVIAVINCFKRHPVGFSFLVIVSCWLIYIVAFYPLILSRDPSFQIKQYFNVHTKYSEYAVQLDPNVHLTAHHPVIHTLLLGGCIEVGRFFGSDNFGLFIYAMLQVITLALAFSVSISYLYQKRKSVCFSFLLLSIYALVPVFPLYAMSAVKDTIYTALIIFYVLFLFDFIEEKDKVACWKKMLFFILSLLIFLFRNNGIYIILFSMIPLMFYKKKEFLSLGIIFVMVFGSYFTYNKVLLPAFKITPGSKREMLSVPFQQTARYVKNYDEEISSKEREVIDKILGYDDLATRYNPILADPVKNGFNKYADDEDLKDYFTLWFQQFFKHPQTYIGATLHNTYGYFYPNATNWYIYYKYNKLITEDHLVSYHYNGLKSLRNVLSGFGLSFPYIPVLGLLVNIGFQGWILLGSAVYLIISRNKKYLICLCPLYVSLLICFVSPANTYFRYAMPYVFALPFVCLYLRDILRKGLSN